MPGVDKPDPRSLGWVPAGVSPRPRRTEIAEKVVGGLNRGLDVLLQLGALALVTKIGLDRAGIAAVVGQLETAGLAQHVGVDLEAEVGTLAQPLDQLLVAVDRDRRLALGHKQVRRPAHSLQPTQGPQFAVAQVLWHFDRRMAPSSASFAPIR